MIDANPDLSWTSLAARLRPFIRRRVASDADTDDVLQEVLLRMHRGLHNLQDDTRLAAWMYRIGRSAIADHLRARQRRGPARAPQAGEVTHVPLEANEDAVAAPVATYVASLVAHLPSPYREAIQLSELEGRSHKQAAQMLGISLSAMKSRVLRGRAKLRTMLEA